MDRLLKTLSDLYKTGDQRISAVRIVVHTVSGHQETVPIGNRNDHSRGDLRILSLSALRAYQRALGLAVFHQVTAASAVLSALLKAVNLGSSDPCERLVHRMHLPIRRCRAELICVGDMFRHLCHIIIMISIDREQIVRVLFQRFFVFREIRKLRNLMILLSCFSQKCLALLDKEDKVLILRLRLSVSQIKFMWGDFLDHSFSPIH